MKGYKGFNKGLVCRGKQYAENTVFEEEKANMCESGMHFCDNPIDVLDYYGFVNENGELNEFAEVESLGETLHRENKYCTTKLKVVAKFSFSGFVKACVDFILEKTSLENEEVEDENNGYHAQIGSSGNHAQIGSSGDSARIGSSGNHARIGSSGYHARIGSSGNHARIGSSGEDSVICCSGHGSAVKAKKGSWITLSEWEYDEKKERNVPVCVKTERVDGEKIKEDTFYKLENGEFVEVN